MSSRQPVPREAFVFQASPKITPSINAKSLSDYMYDCERRYIDQVLKDNAGRISKSATALGISRKNLWAKMKKLRLAAEKTRTAQQL